MTHCFHTLSLSSLYLEIIHILRHLHPCSKACSSEWIVTHIPYNGVSSFPKKENSNLKAALVAISKKLSKLLHSLYLWTFELVFFLPYSLSFSHRLFLPFLPSSLSFGCMCSHSLKFIIHIDYFSQEICNFTKRKRN